MASDNVGLIDAMVTISDGEETVFESDAAVEVEPDTGYWMYTALNSIPAGTTVVINVKISDRPGNVVETTEVIAP